MNFLNASLRGPQTPSAETGSYAYGNATGSSAKTHAPDGVGRFHRRAQRHAARAAARTASSDFQWGLCPQSPLSAASCLGAWGQSPHFGIPFAAHGTWSERMVNLLLVSVPRTPLCLPHEGCRGTCGTQALRKSGLLISNGPIFSRSGSSPAPFGSFRHEKNDPAVKTSVPPTLLAGFLGP